MDKLIRFFKDLPFWIKTGAVTQYGEEKDWIRYKDIFIQIIQLEDGKYSIAYQHDVPSHFPLKDMHIAIDLKQKELPF